MRRFIWLWCLLFIIFAAWGVQSSFADVELDVDSNGAQDINRGGTNATDTSTARSNLGLIIGTDIQAYDADLADLADGYLGQAKITVTAGDSYTNYGDAADDTVDELFQALDDSWPSGVSSAWDDLVAPDANLTLDTTTYTTELQSAVTGSDMFTFTGDGNFGNVSVVKIQESGSPSDGTILEIVQTDTDPDPLSIRVGGTEVVNIDSSGVIAAAGGLNAQNANITNVATINLDTINADGSAITIGDNNETIAINSNDWDISTNGTMTGMAAITSSDIITADTLTDGTMSLNSGSITGLQGITATSGVYDFGGVGAFEIPNGASKTINDTGEIYFDTDIITQGQIMFYGVSDINYAVATTDTPADNEIPKYDSATGTITWEADAGAAGGDSITVDSGAVTDPDFASTGDIGFTDTANTITADINEDVITVSMFANEDWGHVDITGNAATVQDFALTGDADAGDNDIQSVDKLEGVDALVFVDLGADGIAQIAADTAIHLDADDETLTFADGGTNLVTIGTDTGVTEINTTLQFVTTGDIMGGINISSKTAATYTIGTDDAHEPYGTLFINGDNDAIDFTLPSAVAGMSGCIMQSQGSSGAITIQPNTGDYLVVEGARGVAATDYTSSGETKDKICVIAIDTDDWIVTSEVGTWSE